MFFCIYLFILYLQIQLIYLREMFEHGIKICISVFSLVNFLNSLLKAVLFYSQMVVSAWCIENE